ncbi:TonB-dependent receptor [Novosphingobium sp. KCTC 2891]|uniref:TonB-dependent receptor n=1 Tax=Novosphingobium sp. KCTC 2891 TaxID=2989730 RepID=UPI002221DD45|nr:TonB-dependent receptor [Novosphingobium sp. KCTC 2891]MCW1385015.1 TonB-dependent receptor [Novosphingobium sp. KCTC 2891]
MTDAVRNIDGYKALLFVGVAALTLQAVPAIAQEQAAETASAQVDDGAIIVTARKRSETLISVPVAITAVSAAELNRSAINGVDALARKIPGFVIGEGGGTVGGGSISLRGISASESNPLSDQAVSFNVDGVQVARASMRRMGDFDLASVEVLKGPQALFYGKNSPGGIISTRTADPSDRFEAGAKVGYEFNAREVRGEGYVSGPIADGLGARLAFYGSDMQGWTKNLVPATDPRAPNSRRSPNRTEWALRGTLKFDRGGPFNARLKVSHNDARDNGMTNNFQTVDCPTGAPAVGGIVDCKGDDRIVQARLGPDFAKIAPIFNPGISYSDFGPNGDLHSTSKQWLAGLEMNYELSPNLKITSVTGLYKLNFFNVGNFTATAVAPAILGSANKFNVRELSQELRLASNFDGPVNFLLGGQYQDSKVTNASIAAFGAVAGEPSLFGSARPSPFVAANYYVAQKGWAYSAFAQVQIKPIPQVEISGGGRVSNEMKHLTSVINRGVELIGVNPYLSNGGSRRKWDNFSPEVSVSYRPSSDLTFYVNYKQGFLSGGFNGGSFNPAGDFSYRPELVKGWEGGIKARALDGMISAELALYSYKISDLQVQVTTNGTTQELRNAGKVSSKGVEFSLSVRPAQGLTLYGNVAYAKGEYDQYFATCYAGQYALSKGTGIGQCADQPNPTNNGIVGRLQNLNGTELIRAPEWTGNAGIIYSTPLTSNLKGEFSTGVSYSQSFITTATSQPRSRSPQYTLLDASIRLSQTDDKWELALIGRNLTNKFYWSRTSDNPTSAAFPNQLADTLASPSRGREVMLRVGFRY